jgi:hypothetical protein
LARGRRCELGQCGALRSGAQCLGRHCRRQARDIQRLRVGANPLKRLLTALLFQDQDIFFYAAGLLPAIIRAASHCA